MHEPQYFEIYVVVPFSHVLKHAYVRITVNLFFFLFFQFAFIFYSFHSYMSANEDLYIYNFDDGMNSP